MMDIDDKDIEVDAYWTKVIYSQRRSAGFGLAITRRLECIT